MIDEDEQEDINKKMRVCKKCGLKGHYQRSCGGKRKVKSKKKVNTRAARSSPMRTADNTREGTRSSPLRTTDNTRVADNTRVTRSSPLRVTDNTRVTRSSPLRTLDNTLGTRNSRMAGQMPPLSVGARGKGKSMMEEHQSSPLSVGAKIARGKGKSVMEEHQSSPLSVLDKNARGKRKSMMEEHQSSPLSVLDKNARGKRKSMMAEIQSQPVNPISIIDSPPSKNTRSARTAPAQNLERQFGLRRKNIILKNIGKQFSIQ